MSRTVSRQARILAEAACLKIVARKARGVRTGESGVYTRTSAVSCLIVVSPMGEIRPSVPAADPCFRAQACRYHRRGRGDRSESDGRRGRPALMRRRKKGRVLFAGQSYYHAWYLSRELRKLG